MSSTPYYDRNLSATELLADHRERLTAEEDERAAQRARQIEELRSEVNSASVRLRVWEKIHGLSLPTNPAHPILDVIASATGISVAALQEEQQARRVKRTAQPGTKDMGNGG